MEQKIKGVVFFDVDGTLVDSGHQQQLPSAATMGTIQKLRDNGYACFIATGRNIGNMVQFMDLPFDGIVYADGGAAWIYNEKEIVRPIPKAVVRDLMDTVLNTYHGSLRLAARDISYLSEEYYAFFDQAARVYAEQKGVSTEEIFRMRRIEAWEEEDILEIDIELPSKEAEEEWSKNINDAIQYIYTGMALGKDMIAGEITAKGVTKASGCQEVIDFYGLTAEQAYAFGDSMNDREMLVWAGHGIAMGNADENLKQVADYVTDSVSDEGITTACRYFGLIS